MYVEIPGGGARVETPNADQIDIDVGIEIVIDVEPTHWVAGIDQPLAYKVDENGISWLFYISSTGALGFLWTEDGMTPQGVSSDPLDLNGRVSVRAQYVTELQGMVVVKRARLSIANSPNGPWTEVALEALGSGFATLASVPTAPVIIGSEPVGLDFVGRVYSMQIYSKSGLATPQLVADPNFTIQLDGTTGFTDSVGLTWSLLGGAFIVAAPLPPVPAEIVPGSAGVRWYGCDLITGRIIAELPDIEPGGVLGRRLGSFTSTSFSLPIPIAGPGKPPPNWKSATEPGRTMIVAVPLYLGAPLWAGIVMTRQGGTDATVTLGVATLEAYYDRRWVRDHSWTNQDEAGIIAYGLASDANAIDGIGSGINIVIDAPPTGTLRTRNYLKQDRKTIYEALRELMNVIDGPEWTIDISWGDPARTWFAKTLRVRKRIGVAATNPEAVFQTTNAVFGAEGSTDTRYMFTEDYSAGRGANYVTAYSSGEGEDQPESAPQYDNGLLLGGWPIWENVFQPSSSITDIETLNQHAQSRLDLARLGVTSWVFDARWSVYPLLGEHWNVGDDIRWDVIGHRHPQGVTGVARCVGWDWNPMTDRVIPILVEEA